VLWTLGDLKYQPIDKLELDFKLSEGTSVPDFVWAVVKKDELTEIKKERWDLVSGDNYLFLTQSLTVFRTDLHRYQG
jgi:hypothetical protein